LLNIVNIIEAWGLLNKKIFTKFLFAQSMGILHEKDWPKKASPSLSHNEGWGVRFFNISVNQIGHFEEGQKTKSK
jgi:hypothetical protein